MKQELRMVGEERRVLAGRSSGLVGLTSVKRSYGELVGVKKYKGGMELGGVEGPFASKSGEICGKEVNLRLTVVCGLVTVGANVNQCSTSRTGSRRRSSRRQRGLLSNVRTISTKTHGWQRSWVFLCDLRPPVKTQKPQTTARLYE